MEKKKKIEYGYRVFGQNETISNNPYETGLNGNDICFGTAGKGKTGSYVIPNIQNIDGSLIVSDTKGQLARMFKRELREKGYIVYTLDFVNPEKSAIYNPLRYIRRYSDGGFRDQDIMSIAQILCPPGQDRDAPMWEQLTQNFIAMAISYVMEEYEEKDRSLVKASEFIRDFNIKYKNGYLDRWMILHEGSLAEKKFNEILSYKDAEKMFASVLGMANNSLQMFSLKEAEYIFCEEQKRALPLKNIIDIEKIGERKTVLFINVSDMESTFDNMIILLYSQLMSVLCRKADANSNGKLDCHVRIIMDDFAASTKIPNFTKYISVMRSRDIAVSIVLQSLTQLESLYNHGEATTIINNCDHLLYWGGQDPETADFVAQRANLPAEAILNMPKEKAYLIVSGENARLIDKIPPYSTCRKIPKGEAYEQNLCG